MSKVYSSYQTYQPPLSATPSCVLTLLFCPGERCSSCSSSGITQARRRKRTIIFNICQTHDSTSPPSHPPTHHTHMNTHKSQRKVQRMGVCCSFDCSQAQKLSLSLLPPTSPPPFSPLFFQCLFLLITHHICMQAAKEQATIGREIK